MRVPIGGILENRPLIIVGYDPVNNIIHLEYDGKQGWGDTRYYIHREYSNPQFDGV